MIVAHHGGELPLVLSTVLGAGAIPPLLVLVRARFSAASTWLRRRTPE